jgi:hypothetical protein
LDRAIPLDAKAALSSAKGRDTYLFSPHAASLESDLGDALFGLWNFDGRSTVCREFSRRAPLVADDDCTHELIQALKERYTPPDD